MKQRRKWQLVIYSFLAPIKNYNIVNDNKKTSYFVEAESFFFSCIFLNLFKTLSLLIKTPRANPDKKAPVIKDDFIAKLINFIKKTLLDI